MEPVTMQLSDWFTIVTILVAVLAFYKSEERKLLLLKIGSKKLWFTAFILFLALPFLLLYDSRIGYYIPCSLTFLASDWAFSILLGTAGYWVWWFFKKLHKQPISKEVVMYYKEATNTLPIAELLRLFVKYEVPLQNSSNYAMLVLHKPFFKGALQHNPVLLMKLINEVEVIVLLEHKIPLIIKDEILIVLAAEKRNGTLSVYNQEPLIIDSERDDLVLFILLECYFAMLNKCIEENKFNTSQFGMLNYFLPTIFKEILGIIQVNDRINLKTETPTYNHELLNILLSYFDDILSGINKKNDAYKMVVSHFAPIYCDCIVALFEKNDVVKANYLKIQFKSFLVTYFEEIYDFTDSINSINTKLVEQLTKEPKRMCIIDFFNECWNYADEDIFVNGLTIPGTSNEKRDKFMSNVVNKVLNKNQYQN